MSHSTQGAVQKHAELSYPWPDAPERGNWQTIAEGVVWLRMPLPLALDHINLYLLRHDNGWVIVDTGLATRRSHEVWERVFREVMEDAPVKAVIATHFHHDHAGCLGWLSTRFQCPVYMTQGEYHALFINPPEDGQLGWEAQRYYERCGVPEQVLETFAEAMASSPFKQDAPGSFQRLSEHQILRIGGRDWEVVIGSGHSPEHACLLCRQDNLFLSGDQVLPRITSSIGVFNVEPDANPLGDWLRSIRRLRRVPDDVLVLPAHELPFYGLHHRLTQLMDHHLAHFDVILEQLVQPMTVYELMLILFPRARSAFDVMMANGETLAHLNYLMAEERVVRRTEGNCYRYQSTRKTYEALAGEAVTHI